MPHQVSTEILSHFNCSRCGKWWSIGDYKPDGKGLFCPWCGTHDSVEDHTDGAD